MKTGILKFYSLFQDKKFYDEWQLRHKPFVGRPEYRGKPKGRKVTYANMCVIPSN